MHIVRAILLLVLAGTLVALGDPNFVPTNPAAAEMREAGPDDERAREEQLDDYRYDVPPEAEEEIRPAEAVRDVENQDEGKE